MMSLPSRIYLTGFMGSGKSTIGPILANVIGYDFIDLDAAIVEALGQAIPTYFAEAGEAAFREVEARIFNEISQREHIVVATGGGTLIQAHNLARAQATGLIIYLRLTLDQLVNRLKRSKNRPLLEDDTGQRLPKETMRTRIATLLETREPVYNQADLVLETGHLAVGIAVDKVMDALRLYSKSGLSA